MKIKTWLISSYLIVMILPIISLYFFYVSLTKYDEKQDLIEYMETMEKIDKLNEVLLDPSLYKVQSVDNYQKLKNITDSSMNITLYRHDGLKLYSTLDQVGVEVLSIYNRDFLFQDLNMLKKGHRTNSYKRTVFHEDKLIGIYQVTMVRNDWLENVNNQTLILSSFLVLTCILIFTGAVLLLNRKLNRPLNMLREEMMAFAKGDKGRNELPRNNDELGELISHFEQMREQIELTNQEVERQQKEKEFIVAALSHDLKTPLTAIRAYFEALKGQQKLTEQEKKEYREIIFEKLDHMKEMVDDLVLYTTLKSSSEKVTFVEVDGEEFFDMLLGGYEEPCSEKQINLTVEQEVNGNFLLNPKQMIRVVDNLMSNAVRYTPPGKRIWLSAISSRNSLPKWIFPVITEELENWRKNGTVLLIQNEGEAINHKNLERVFEPFVQVEAARGQGGTSGLGLSIAKMVMEQHGGKIKLWSAHGYGTLVACWLGERMEY